MADIYCYCSTCNKDDGQETKVEKMVIVNGMWCNHDNHKEETKAVKKALAGAGINAKVTHDRGTAWGWLHINLGDPKQRNGLKLTQFGCQYTEEELDLHKKALKIVQEVTGRHGDYDGKIIILAQ